MSDIAKELFKTIVTDTASQEDFSSAIKQKMDLALDVRKAGLTAGIYNQQSASSETFEESVEEVKEAEKITKKERDALEDNNQHGELALRLAQSFGTPAEVKKIKSINKKHMQRGSIMPKDQKERNAISSKYYKMAESLEEASSGDIEKILKFAAKNGGKRKGNVVDFGGSKIEFSLDKGKIKFDGGKNSGVEHFDNLRDAISALSIGMED